VILSRLQLLLLCALIGEDYFNLELDEVEWTDLRYHHQN